YAPPPRIVEARGLLVAGTARFEFGWAGEPRRVSVDLHTGEARLEENGLTLASAGSFREWKAVDAPKYVRHAMGVRLPGVVSQPVEAPGHTCLRYFDLAIDDVFVVRRTLVDGTVYDQVAVEAGFLQSEASAPIDCRMRSVATPVQLEVESGFVVQPVASSRSAYFAIAFSGTDRVVRRFHVTPGTQTVRLVFSENDVVEVDLERGTARVLRISAVKTAEVPGPHDVRKLWESRETDRAGYLRSTYLRSHTTRARGADICGELKMGIEPTYVPSGEAEALWELRAALECE
ncbi:MAG: hypothetical protein JNM17_26790, partial [Archangium sp.]|nr:hypothetical protein [Archangium sp.]